MAFISSQGCERLNLFNYLLYFLLMKKLTFILLIQLLTLNILGQNSLLWKITGKGLNQPSYLFGTIHIICADDFFLDSAVMSAIGHSNQMVFEVDLSDPAVMNKTMQASLNEDKHNIKSDLSERDQLLLDSCLKADFKLGIDQMGVLKPWYLMVTLSMMNLMDCSSTKQYETELLKIARTKGMKTGELETIEYQLGIFDSIPYKRQLEMLMETVKEKNEDKEAFQQLELAYLDQDVEQVHQLMMEEKEMEDFGDLFFYNRNKNWIPVIIQFIHQQPAFIAFGAGHLGGEGGVIDLLRKGGYKVEPVIK